MTSPTTYRLRREAAGARQAKIARLAGISIGHYSRVERGDSQPSPWLQARIEQALAVLEAEQQQARHE